MCFENNENEEETGNEETKEEISMQFLVRNRCLDNIIFTSKIYVITDINFDFIVFHLVQAMKQSKSILNG